MSTAAVDDRVGAPRGPRVRRIALMALAALAGLFYSVMMGGVPALTAPWFDDSTKGHQVHDVAWGIVVFVLLAVPLLLQVHRPETKPAAMQQAFMVPVSFLIAMSLSLAMEPEPVVIMGVPLAILTLLHPARREIFTPGRFSGTLGAMAGMGALGFGAFVLDQAARQRNLPLSNEHTEFLHWATMAVMGIAIVLVALVASLKTRGWRIPAWCAGVASILFGAASLVMNQRPSSVKGWGAVAILGGIAFIGEAEWEHHQDVPEPAAGEPGLDAGTT
ncbi:MAG: hypothetical protein ABR575_03320 [Actinomycetota bacterium]